MNLREREVVGMKSARLLCVVLLWIRECKLKPMYFRKRCIFLCGGFAPSGAVEDVDN